MGKGKVDPKKIKIKGDHKSLMYKIGKRKRPSLVAQAVSVFNTFKGRDLRAKAPEILRLMNGQQLGTFIQQASKSLGNEASFLVLAADKRILEAVERCNEGDLHFNDDGDLVNVNLGALAKNAHRVYMAAGQREKWSAHHKTADDVRSALQAIALQRSGQLTL